MSAVSASRDLRYVELKEYVLGSTGLAYYQSRDRDFQERIDRRLLSRGVESYGAYLELLRDKTAGQTEFDHLTAELTIGETFFFRDEQQFEALRRRILPDLLASDRPRKILRIWSAGCASGAEAYSLSIVLRDELCVQTFGWEVSILGTDVNRRLLAQAEEGRYEKWALRSTTDEVLERCFHRQGSDWRIADRYRQGVDFQYHNLVRDQAPSHLNSLAAFDLILCRNVMIYFDRATAAALVERLHHCLIPGGWLVVGHADHEPNTFRAFEVVSQNGISVYRKPHVQSSSATLQWSPVELTPGRSSRMDWQKEPPDADDTHEAPASNGADMSMPDTLPSPAAGPAAPSLREVRALADAGAWVDAEALCASIIENGPLEPAAHFYHALILEQRGRLVEAEGSLRRAIYLDRKFVLAHYHLAMLLRRGSHPSASRQCFENVLALLADVHDTQVFEHGDGIRAADLRSLTEMNLEGLLR